MVAALTIGSTQQVQAQKLLDTLGKVLDGISKSRSTNSNSKNKGTNNRSSIAGNTTARYKIHETPQTKTIILDGGAKIMGLFSEGRAVIKWKNGWFVIDKRGNKVFSISQDYVPQPTKKQDGIIGYDNNRLMVYSESSKHAIIYDNNGNIIKEFKDAVNASGFSGGVALIAKNEKDPKGWGTNTVWYHIDINGNTLSKDMPTSISGWTNDTYRLFSPTDGLARVRDDKAKRWGFRNNKCQLVIMPTFYRVHEFSDGLAVAQEGEDGKWGYIDKTGQWVIQPIYSKEPGDFVCNRAKVLDKSNCTHYIDKTGKIVWTDPEPIRCNVYGDFMSQIKKLLSSFSAITRR